jgi:hypothetical protein
MSAHLTASSLTVGVDIGQKNDPTAIAVIEARVASEPAIRIGGGAIEYVLRFIQRLPLGTPYPEIAHSLARICRRAAERSGQRPEVFVDATGVGAPVVDQLRALALDARCLWAVTFTHGSRCRRHPAERRVTMGKAYMVSRLQALLGAGRIHLPATSEAHALAAELLGYEIRVDEKGTDRYGAFRSGTHDDLVTALGLAVLAEGMATQPVARASTGAGRAEGVK